MSLTINRDHRSPNHDERGEKIDMIVLHYTGMESGPAALARLCDSEARVSAHYLVEEDGAVFALVDEGRRAWHAGLSHWQGRDNVNGCSVGIEIVNPGHEWGYRKFPGVQSDAVVALVTEIVARHGVPASRVVGHSDVAPERKEDPGELFPWHKLSRPGLALASIDPALPLPEELPDYAAAITMLREIGYGFRDGHPVAAVLAFQRRFLPGQMGQGLNPQTRAAVARVHAQL
ncbi:N-acetylmuramoyl-L-alanine amidase [Parvularcula flava]|uniref:N-acetylmuramoyl-L-alanine amidase n=1 Tax=Aquisalinus luteolus TaxID=1566827 RepID=A0A8J3ES09_9PROT|nr:N-acetylmuramoyl-L-alanine amidase [Aquisalinus luteolus]NHK29373.1 N-acetylmuramoyl-L-alanine amidase [Aquisalinus luteolus]GGI00975.1 N-acetylmuramoyl-L-alanine amidase [Aquisalinus luteolus]